MKLAFLYAGQGSQRVGMGRDLYEAYPAFRPFLDSPAAGFDIKELCFNGPDEMLSQTRYTQPCMVAFGAGVTRLLFDEGIVPYMAAGLSLGEYSALHAASVFDAHTVISLAAFRGSVMQEAAKGIDCAMSAVLGMDGERLTEVCRRAAALSGGVCEIANRNCPGQIVIAGHANAVKEASSIALLEGARKIMPLKVSGPFHTSLMTAAGGALRKRFSSIDFGDMAFPVVFNVTGKPLGEGESVAELLERQVSGSVLFEDSLRFLEQRGVDTVLEIGPGRVLSGFAKKTMSNIKVYCAEDTESLKAAIEGLKGAHQ